MNGKIEIRTQREKALELKHRAICAQYRELSERLKGTTTHRIISIIASQFGMTIQGVRKIIIKEGLYKTKSPE